MSGACRTANATVSAHGAASVTLSDSTEIPMTRALFVGTGGTIKVTMVDGQDVSFTNVPNGSILPIQVIKVWNTGTSGASGILALY